MMEWLFGKKEPIIQFKTVIGEYQVNTPVIPTSKCQTSWMKAQKQDKKFQTCPGMMDYSHTGYLITAHANIHIKCNSAGIMVKVDNNGGPADREMLQYRKFDADVVDGMIHTSPKIKKTAGKVPLPWSITTKKGYSAYVLPAWMHSSFLDKLFVYPGIVDYDNGFKTVNFVFSPFVECEFTIDVGEPLLQIIPFKREHITSTCDRGTNEERSEYTHVIPAETKHFYKRFLSARKKFTMECPYKHKIYEKE